MDEQKQGVLSLFKREPEQLGLILKVGLAAPVAIIFWHWLASYFLPSVAVALVSLTLTVVYGAILTLLAARLVQTIGRWQVESAVQAQRLMAGDRRREGAQEAPGEPPRLEDVVRAVVAESLPASSLFHETYFLLRLQEEVMRARREGRHLSVVVLEVTLGSLMPTSEQLDKLSLEVARLASEQAKTISLPLQSRPTEFVFGMADHDRPAARLFISELVGAMGEYWCHYGLAVYPDDGTDAEALFRSARENCRESRSGSAEKGKSRIGAFLRRSA